MYPLIWDMIKEEKDALLQEHLFFLAFHYENLTENSDKNEKNHEIK